MCSWLWSECALSSGLIVNTGFRVSLNSRAMLASSSVFSPAVSRCMGRWLGLPRSLFIPHHKGFGSQYFTARPFTVFSQCLLCSTLHFACSFLWRSLHRVHMYIHGCLLTPLSLSLLMCIMYFQERNEKKLREGYGKKSNDSCRGIRRR